MTDEQSLAKARQAIERALTGPDARRGAGSRGKVRRLAANETIGGLNASLEQAASAQGSARILTASPEPVIEVVKSTGWVLPEVSVGQWSLLDRGRVVCSKVLAAVGWANGEDLRATYPAAGVVRLKPGANAKHARIELSRGRIQLSAGVVRRANIASWPGVVVVTDTQQVFLVNIGQSRFDSDRRPS